MEKKNSSGFIIYKYGPFKYRINWDVAVFLKTKESVIANSNVEQR